MPFFYMLFLLRQSPVYVFQSPKGLQNDIKFRGSTFDPMNEIVLESRDGGERQEFPGTGEERKPFLPGRSSFKETKALHFSESDAFPGGRRFPANCRAHSDKSGRFANSHFANRFSSPRDPDKNPRSHKYKVPWFRNAHPNYSSS